MISNRWKIILAALPIIGMCAMAQPQPGGLGGFYQAWYGSIAAGPKPELSLFDDAVLFLPFTFNFDDESTNAIAVTQNGNPLTVNGVAQFDGTNSWLHYGDSSTVEVGTNDFSFSVWLKLSGVQPEVLGSDTLAHVIGNTLDGLFRGGGISLVNETIYLQFRTASTLISLSDTNNLNNSSWHHIVATFNRDENMTIYINKNNVASTSIAAGNGLDLQDSRDFKVGARTFDNAFEYFGQMDTAYYFKRLLTIDEIEQLYNQGHN